TGTRTAPRVSQDRARVTVTARSPARPESSQNCDRPDSISSPPNVHPAGSSVMHGTNVAEGTDCAIRIRTLPWLQVGALGGPADRSTRHPVSPTASTAA